MNIDLTIIIPHYNTPQYLRNLLESVPVYDNIQTIVIDDRSDLHIAEYESLKKEACFKKILFLDNISKNKGAGACRNIGLQHALGKWVLFADSDDFFIEEFCATIEEYFTSNYDVIFFVPTSADRDTMEIAYRHLNYRDIICNYFSSPSIKHELSLRYFMTSPWSKMIRLDLINKYQIKFDEVRVSNDIAFSTKVGYHMKNFIVSCETIYCVTNSTGTLTKTLNEENYDIRLNVFVWRCKFLKEHLTKKELYKLDMLELNKGFQFVTLMKYKLGVKKFISVVRIFRKNRISFVDLRYLNPLFLAKIFKLVVREYKSHKANRRFYTK